MEKVDLFAANSDSLKLVALTDDLIPNFRGSRGGSEFIVGLPAIAPGQTVDVSFEYAATRDDPNANIQFSVASPAGGTASQTVPISAKLPSNSNRGSSSPNFGTSPGISIPSDPAVGGPTVLDSAPLDVKGRFAQRTVQAGGKVEYQGSITNTTAQPLTRINIDFTVPNSLSISDFRASDGSKLISATAVQRIFRLEPGQTINFVAETTAGSIPGPATMEVRVRSNEIPLAITATDQVIVN